jgi:hypothetical protein
VILLYVDFEKFLIKQVDEGKSNMIEALVEGVKENDPLYHYYKFMAMLASILAELKKNPEQLDFERLVMLCEHLMQQEFKVCDWWNCNQSRNRMRIMHLEKRLLFMMQWLLDVWLLL